jgi:hypothetical protein
MMRQIFFGVMILIFSARSEFAAGYTGPSYGYEGPYPLARIQCSMTADKSRCSNPQKQHRCITTFWTIYAVMAFISAQSIFILQRNFRRLFRAQRVFTNVVVHPATKLLDGL